MEKRIVRRSSMTEVGVSLSNIPLLDRLYCARQINSVVELDRGLEHLLPFHTLLGIDQAVQILASAIMQDEKIVIVGDFDADGATSTAVALRALKAFGAQFVDFLVPNRFAYGYGLTPELVIVAKNMAPSIILTVDNGIANLAGVEAAKEAGMRVVITDHHLPSTQLPVADAIVNPNQPHDPFPSKNLAGVGVIFYVMIALRRYLSENNWFEKRKLPVPNLSNLLDIVALGTVADLVPLDHNNRILVHQGLRRIRAGKCVPGIVALLELSNRNFNTATAQDLGYAVAARLNAAGRLEDMSLGIECLLTDDSYLARQMARQLDKLNRERRNIEKDMQMQALNALEKLGENLKGELPRGLCLFDETWHQGVIGILASRIKDKFNRPTIVFAPGTDGELKGSARSINGLHIRDLLAAIDATYPNFIKKFGGHAMAAGLTIEQNSLQEFSEVFAKNVAAQLKETDLEHLILSDGPLTVEELSLEVAYLLRDAGPWGQAFPEPLFDDIFEVVDQRLIADKHLKMRLCKESKVLDAVAFFVDISHWPNHRCQTIQAAYRLDVNLYNGRETMQLILEHMVPLN